MIIKEIERLCSFTDSEWIIWQTDIKPIVEHNYQNLLLLSNCYDKTNAEKMFVN